MLCGTLICVVALLMGADLALAGPPSWDDQINNPSRFKVLKEFNDAAVLDMETGLVWEQSPSTATGFYWLLAQGHCNLIAVGNRSGWRLPTFQELASLTDGTQSDPALPLGHPFSNVQNDRYWSATDSALIPGRAWGVTFSNGDTGTAPVGDFLFVWCVRGGQGRDTQ